MTTRTRARRTYAPPRYAPEPYYAPEPEPPQTPALVKVLLTVFYLAATVMVIAVAVAYWPLVRAAVLAPAPAVEIATQRPVAPQVPAQQPAAPIEMPAVEQPAPAQPAAPVIVEAPAAPIEAPAAVVAVPTPAAVVVPVATARIAPESYAPTAAPAPTVATTAFMQIGKDFSTNTDGTCVRTQRDGSLVEFCQVRPMSIGEMSAVADFLRTGRIAGEVVK